MGFEVSPRFFKVWPIEQCEYTYKKMGMCFANNPAAPYITYAVPPWPEEFVNPVTSTMWGPSLPGYFDVFRFDPTPGQSSLAPGRTTGLTTYALDADASGVIETIDNIVNMTVVSRDANDLKAEYRAGFVQGRLQGDTILSARDNSWDNAYLFDPSHSFPKQPGPTAEELNRAAEVLNANYAAFLDYLEDPTTDAVTAHRLQRLLFRMLGIYHGVMLDQPADLDFSGDWLPDGNYFQARELALGYETEDLTFMDLYFINAFCDLLDVISFSPELAPGGVRSANYPHRCSAFLKRSGSEVILTHNTWSGFLSQTMAQTLAVNDDLLTFNALTPGLIGSNTDFGFNNKGILFNETTHRASYSEVKPLGLWVFWRAALAEQFSASIDDFFDAISLDNTGTYQNGYMLADANTGETGLVEMSYRCFVFYRSDGGPLHGQHPLDGRRRLCHRLRRRDGHAGLPDGDQLPGLAAGAGGSPVHRQPSRAQGAVRETAPPRQQRAESQTGHHLHRPEQSPLDLREMGSRLRRDRLSQADPGRGARREGRLDGDGARLHGSIRRPRSFLQKYRLLDALRDGTDRGQAVHLERVVCGPGSPCGMSPTGWTAGLR